MFWQRGWVVTRTIRLDAMPGVKPKRSKYLSQKSGNYDSRKEARRAMELHALQRQGLISGLQEQVKFELIPSQEGERPVNYYADFVYWESDGVSARLVVEDVKRPETRTKDYIIKRKLMLWVHQVRIREI